MDPLPLEVVLLITEFLSEKDFDNLIGLNKFFFSLVLDKRYAHVDLRGEKAFTTLDRIG